MCVKPTAFRSDATFPFKLSTIAFKLSTSSFGTLSSKYTVGVTWYWFFARLLLTFSRISISCIRC